MADPSSNTGPFGVPPGGPWFVFEATGTIQRQSDPALAVALATAGWQGYATEAGAKAAIAANPATAIKGGVKDATAVVTDTAGGIAEGAHWLGRIVTALTDIHMWISLGWLLLGLIMLWEGMVWLLRLPQKGAHLAGQVAPLAAAA